MRVWPHEGGGQLNVVRGAGLGGGGGGGRDGREGGEGKGGEAR